MDRGGTLRLRALPTVSVNPRALPGPITIEPGNRGHEPLSGVPMSESSDWGTGRLFAYAHFTIIVVTDPASCQIITTLDHHAERVTAIRMLDAKDTGDVQLASGDCAGNLIVWDVRDGSPTHFMQCSQSDVKTKQAILSIRQIRQPKIPDPSISRTMCDQVDIPLRLLCLTPSALVMMDVSTQMKMWRVELGSPEEPLVGMSINTCGDCLVFNSASGVRILRHIDIHGSNSQVSSFNVSDSGRLEQAMFCPGTTNQVILVMRTEIILYDVTTRRQLDSLHLSSGRSEFRAAFFAPGAEFSALSIVLGLSGPLPLFTFHMDGSISAWIRHESTQGWGVLEAPAAGHSQQVADLRGSRQGYFGRPYLLAIERIPGGAISNGCEEILARFAVVANDGTVATWEYTYEGWRVMGLMPTIPAQVTAMAVMHLAVSACETRQSSSRPNCVVVTTVTGLVVILDILTGDIIARVDAFTERTATLNVLANLSPTSVLIGGSRSTDKGFYNCIASLSLPSFRIEDFKGKEAEPNQLQRVEVSFRRLFFVALYTGGVCEVWDAPGRWLLQKFSINYTTVTWMPAAFSQPLEQQKDKDGEQPPPSEVGLWLSPDGLMSFFRVRGGQVKHYRDNPSFMQTRNKILVGFGYPVVTADWYDDLLLTGDVAGMMCLVNVRTAKFSHINDNQQRSPIKQVAVCPRRYVETRKPVKSAEGEPRQRRPVVCLALILFNDEEFGIWDVGQKQRLSYSKGVDQKTRELRATAVGWVPGPFPIVATTTGTVFILDLSLGTSCACTALRSLVRPLRTMVLLVRPHASYIKACLMNGVLDIQKSLESADATFTSSLLEQAAVKPPFRNAFGELTTEKVTTHSAEVNLHMQLIHTKVRAELEALSTAENVDNPFAVLRRSLITAALFADEPTMQFWRAAIMALHKKTSSRLVHPAITARQQSMQEALEHSAHAVSPVPEDEDKGVKDEAYGPEDSIGAQDELLLDNQLLYAVEIASVATREKAARKHVVTKHYSSIASEHVQLGSMQPAVQLLLDTPHTAQEWKSNLYKACMVSAGISTIHYQHTVKRVASMFISHGDIEGAVELLCLIGKGFEACKALQSHERWEEAARLAKTTLPSHEAHSVLKKWAMHLKECGEILHAACVLITTGDVLSTLQLLEPHPHFCELAAVLAVAFQPAVTPSSAPILASIYSHYSDFLLSLGASPLAGRYAARADACWKSLESETPAQPPPPLSG